MASALDLIPKARIELKNKKYWANVFLTDDTQKWYGRPSDYRVHWQKGKAHDDGTCPLLLKPENILVLGDACPRLATLFDGLFKGCAITTVQSFDEIKDSETYEWAIDNGYSDRLASCEPDISIVDNFQRLLNKTSDQGSIVLITLGFDSVISAYLRLFTKLNYEYTVIPIKANKEDSNDPVLMLTIRKVVHNEASNTPPSLTVWHHGWSIKPLPKATFTMYGLCRYVKELRRHYYRQQRLSTLREGQLLFFDIIEDLGTDHAKVRYSLSVYDRVIPKNDPNIRAYKSTVSILVPLADQHHWLYKTTFGHQKLAERAGCKRVVCTFLPEFGEMIGKKIHPVETVNRIKSDIGVILIELAADQTPVLLMTQQEQFEDERETIAQAESPYAGKIMVFNAAVDIDDEELRNASDFNPTAQAKAPKASKYIRRTLIFECSPRCAQSEIWMYPDDNGTYKFEWNHICHSYHILIMRSMLQIKSLAAKEPTKCCVLGIGGGVLSTSLINIFGDILDITSVDIDQEVVRLAKECFGLAETEKHRIIVGDGLEHIAEMRKNSKKLNVLIVDINGSQDGKIDLEHGITGPHPSFFDRNFLADAAEVVGNNGYMIVNAVCQTDYARKHLASIYQQHFRHVTSLRFTRDLNEVFICDNTDTEPPPTGSKLALEDSRAVFRRHASEYSMLSELMEKNPLYLSKKSRAVVDYSMW